MANVPNTDIPVREPQRRCVRCGRPVTPMSKTWSFDPRGVQMGVFDKQRLFCTLACAAQYGIAVALRDGRHRS